LISNAAGRGGWPCLSRLFLNFSPQDSN